MKKTGRIIRRNKNLKLDFDEIVLKEIQGLNKNIDLIILISH